MRKLLASAAFYAMLAMPAWATDFNWDMMNDCGVQEQGIRAYLTNLGTTAPPNYTITENYYQDGTQPQVTTGGVQDGGDSYCALCETETWFPSNFTPPGRWIGSGDALHFGISIQQSTLYLNKNPFVLFLDSNQNPETKSWPRLSEQFFRIDKWSVCRG